MMFYDKKVLLVLEESFETDSKKFASNSTWAYFALNFLKFFKQSYIYVPMENVKECTKKNIFKLPENISIVGRPHYASYKDYYFSLVKNYLEYKKITEDYVKKVDIVIVRAPAQISNFVISACKKYDKKLIVIFAGNFLSSATPLLNSSGIKKMMFYFIAKHIERGHISLARESRLMILYGKELAQAYSKYNDKYIFSNTPTISESELFFKEDTCDGKQINIIRIGSYLPNKDYETLIKAVKVLREEKDINVVLNTYGSVFDDKYYEFLLEMSDVKYIHLNPPIPFGEQLFKKYKNSDIQIITSKSEGIPRTIVEGASFSLPLITTNVGGIGTNIKDRENGLFIKTESVESLVCAIVELIENQDLRRNIIQNGFDMASKMTIEKISRYIAEEVNNAS